MKAIIMAGGKGTRVASLTKNQIPKPMLPLDGKPILEWQLMQLKKYGITEVTMVIGYLGDVIKDYFGDGSAWGMHISYIVETEPLGTAGALYYLRRDVNANASVNASVDTSVDASVNASVNTSVDASVGTSVDTSVNASNKASGIESTHVVGIQAGSCTDAEDYFFCMGDIFFDFDILRMKKFHDDKGAFITLLAHPNMHPQDSDLVVADKEKRVTAFDSKHNVRDYWYDNLVNAGIFIFSPSVPDLVKEPAKLSLEKELIAPILEEKKVYAYVTPEFIKDVGTPDRIEATEEDLKSGLIAKKNLEKKQKAIFLDRDGTINEFNGFVGTAEDFELIDNAAEAVKKINRSGYLAVVVTNQPVIARGEATVEDVEEIHRKLKTLLGREGCYIDDIIYCPHHPDKGFAGEVPELKIVCNCRKPKTGMIEEAARRWNIDLADSWVIGDGTIDIEMGRRGGCRTVLVQTGQAGLDGKADAVPDYTAADILAAVNLILEK